MRKLLGLMAGVSLAMAASSAAADGMKGGSLKDVGCVPVFQGFYIGAQGGYAQFESQQNDQDGFLTDNSSWSATQGRFTGGVQAGYNWQRGCNTLFGVEADWSWGKLDARTVDDPGDDPGFMTTSIRNYGTLRTRAGLVFDNLLIYATGGLAVARFNFNVTEDDTTFSASDTRWGWTAGFGTEYMLTKNISFKSEVLYLNFGDKTHTFPDGDDGTASFKTLDSMWVTRAALNFKF